MIYKGTEEKDVLYYMYGGGQPRDKNLFPGDPSIAVVVVPSFSAFSIFPNHADLTGLASVGVSSYRVYNIRLGFFFIPQ